MPLRAILFFIWHFLKPTTRARARSAISILATLIIALVVALTLVYTSVTHGIEQRWERQISTFWSPLRLIPTNQYYNSYVYRIPLFCSARDYSYQTLGQELQFQGHPPLQRARSDAMMAQLLQDAKLKSAENWNDSFDPLIDPPLPAKLLRAKRALPFHPLLKLNESIDRYRTKDLSLHHHFPTLGKGSYRLSAQNIEWIEVFHSIARWKPQATSPFCSYPSLIPPKEVPSQANSESPSKETIEEVESAEIEAQEWLEQEELIEFDEAHLISARLAYILSYAKIPRQILTTLVPLSKYEWQRLHRILSLQERQLDLRGFRPPHLPPRLLARLVELAQARTNSKEQDDEGHEIMQALNTQACCVWLPSDYKEAGISVGDTIKIHHLKEEAHQASPGEKQLLVVGFYYAEIQGWASRSMIVSAPTGRELYLVGTKAEPMVSNHIGVWFQKGNRHQFKKVLEKQFDTLGGESEPLSNWFQVETLEDYSFCKDFILQLASDRILLIAVSILILIVASSSIVSMLIILVHERRDAIAIFRVLGIPSQGITTLFAVMGLFLGLISSLLGLLFGMFFLQLLPFLAALLSSHLGYAFFNPLYFGKTIPTSIDLGSALWITLTTSLLSFVAGMISARYASSFTPQKLLQNY